MDRAIEGEDVRSL